MKKIILALAVLFSLSSYSQISINSTHMPSSGDTLRYSTAILDTAILLNYQNSGANLTWNFDSLRPIAQDVQRFVPSSQTPYNNDVPSRIGLLFADTLSLGGFSIYEAYNFINSTTTDFSIDFRGATAPTGLSFPFPTTVKLVGSYTDKDEVFQFPLNYLDRDSSTFNFVYDNQFLGVYYGSSGYRINNVDAWGSLTTPYGTFNCIRVVTDMVSYDTVSFQNQSFGINSHTREYQWISDQIKIPALKVNGNVVAGFFIPTTVEYRDSVRIIEPLLPTIALFNADSTNIEKNKSLDFTNFSLGSSSFQWDFTPNTVTYLNGTSATSRNISVSFQDTGFYDVRLIAMGGTRADTLLRSNYIKVTEPAQLNLPVPAFEALYDTALTQVFYTIYNKSTSKSPATYLWDITPKTFSFSSGTDSTSADSIIVQFADTGYYNVKLIAMNKDGSDSLTKTNFVYVRTQVGLGEINEAISNQIKLLPNPTVQNEMITVVSEKNLNIEWVEIYDASAKLVEQIRFTNERNSVELMSPKTSGLYYIKISTGKGVALKKLLVN